ncbi:MAG: YidC/Oxa1 family membrane protein insertase [Actinobacteria bacterium]|nr:YidC/Oxa1 family membrane protein insertase [Actinomycetota bacterium]
MHHIILANVMKDAVSWLIGPLDALLRWLHDTGNLSWGMSIIALTVIVRGALFPLTYKQITSMIHMQQFQPQIKEINEKYKEDPQRKQQELMKFFKEHKINPLASCLPILVQLPFFIAVFYALQDKALQADIRATGESFLFIPDLVAKPGGAELVILLVLYAGSQLGSTIVSLTPTTDDMQRKLMLALPFLFMPFIINFPAGLILYWITTNTWTFGQAVIVRKLRASRLPADVLNPPKKGAKDDTVGKPDNGAVEVAVAEKKAPPPPPRQKKKRSGRRR